MHKIGPEDGNFDVREMLDEVIFVPNAWRGVVSSVHSHQASISAESSDTEISTPGYYDSRLKLNQGLEGARLLGARVFVSGKNSPYIRIMERFY